MITITTPPSGPEVDPGAYKRFPILHVGKSFSLLSDRNLEVLTVYSVRVPEGARLRLRGAGRKKGQKYDVQYLETVSSMSTLDEGNYEPIIVTISCARKTGAGIKVKAGDVIAYLENDLAADFKVNTQVKVEKAA